MCPFIKKKLWAKMCPYIKKKVRVKTCLYNKRSEELKIWNFSYYNIFFFVIFEIVFYKM